MKGLRRKATMFGNNYHFSEKKYFSLKKKYFIIGVQGLDIYLIK